MTRARARAQTRVNLPTLPQELIDIICELLDSEDVYSLGLGCRDLSEKVASIVWRDGAGISLDKDGLYRLKKLSQSNRASPAIRQICFRHRNNRTDYMEMNSQERFQPETSIRSMTQSAAGKGEIARDIAKIASRLVKYLARFLKLRTVWLYQTNEDDDGVPIDLRPPLSLWGTRAVFYALSFGSGAVKSLYLLDCVKPGWSNSVPVSSMRFPNSWSKAFESIETLSLCIDKPWRTTDAVETLVDHEDEGVHVRSMLSAMRNIQRLSLSSNARWRHGATSTDVNISLWQNFEFQLRRLTLYNIDVSDLEDLKVFLGRQSGTLRHLSFHDVQNHASRAQSPSEEDLASYWPSFLGFVKDELPGLKRLEIGKMDSIRRSDGLRVRNWFFANLPTTEDQLDFLFEETYPHALSQTLGNAILCMRVSPYQYP